MSHGGSMSARGVAGEVTSVKDSVLAVGGVVPNYTIYGTAHHNYPGKDKAKFASVPERPEWSQKPKHQTRAEMLEARRRERFPDLSADVDGDGAIGATDFFVAKQFSSAPPQGPLRLNTGERQKVVESLENGFIDKYSFGHDSAGINRPFAVKQRRGVVFTSDSAHEVSKTYPAHPISQNTPRYPTRTDMTISRKAYLHSKGKALNDEWSARNPAMIPEDHPKAENWVEQPAMTNISQRLDAYRQYARDRAGLDPVSNLNPDRKAMESVDDGMGYRASPPATTKTQLQQQRRAQRVDDLRAARMLAEEDYVPRTVHQNAVAADHFDAARNANEQKTLAKLQFERKREMIEYNMANFEMHHPPPLPCFSDRHEPWWTLQDGYVPEPPPCLLRELQKMDAEITAKPTQVMSGRRASASQPASARARAAGVETQDPNIALSARLGHRLNKQAPLPFYKQPRHNEEKVKQAMTYSTDSAPLESFSTLSAGVPKSVDPVLVQQQRRATEAYDNAQAWKAYTRRGDPFDPSVASPLLLSAPMHSQYDSFSLGQARKDPCLSASEQMSQVGRPTLAKKATQADVAPAPPEDLPMTSRLQRIGGAKMDATQPFGQNTGSLASRSPRRGMSNSASLMRSSLEEAMRTGRGPQKGQSVAVRSSGFQWLNKKFEEDLLPTSASKSSPTTP